MLNALFTKLFGSRNERVVKKMGKTVDQVNALEDVIKALSDEELMAQTTKLKKRLSDGEKLDDLLPEAFATVREASVRTLGLRHYDVQLVGGIVLHEGRIAEMKTGEGKTLMATLACYLNALSGKSVHVVTVNDYTRQQKFDGAAIVLDHLGEPGMEFTVLAGDAGGASFVNVALIERIFEV